MQEKLISGKPLNRCDLMARQIHVLLPLVFIQVLMKLLLFLVRHYFLSDLRLSGHVLHVVFVQFEERRNLHYNSPNRAGLRIPSLESQLHFVQ